MYCSLAHELVAVCTVKANKNCTLIYFISAAVEKKSNCCQMSMYSTGCRLKRLHSFCNTARNCSFLSRREAEQRGCIILMLYRIPNQRGLDARSAFALQNVRGFEEGAHFRTYVCVRKGVGSFAARTKYHTAPVIYCPVLYCTVYSLPFFFIDCGTVFTASTGV